MGGSISRGGMTRRYFIMGAAAVVGSAALGVPVVRAADKSLKIGVYGGYFKDSFDKHIFPTFTSETGIEVESVAEPTGEAWLVQLEQAAKAGVAPADVSMMANVPRLRGVSSEIWATFDESKFKNLDGLLPHLVNRYADGKLYSVGAVTWFITLCSNTNVFPEAPGSWADMWAEDKKDKLGLLALASNSYLIEITAKTFFGGYDILATQEGISKVLDKLAEIKPNVKLWYRDEGQFQQALQSGEIPMGQYYHDVTGLAAADGYPVRSTFPKEGGVIDSGSWCVSKASKKQEEALIFMDWMSQPKIQSMITRKVGTAPTVKRSLLDLTDEEFAAASSEIDPVVPVWNNYLKWGDWIDEQWTRMVTG